MKLVFATRNRGKVTELRELLADVAELEVLSLDDVSVPEVVEDGDTFEANAIKKAREVSQASGLMALADDSGLCVDALGGAPGVHSARYAGPNATDADNNRKLLAAMADVPAGLRSARFVSVLAVADTTGSLGSTTLVSTGACEGTLLDQPRGTGGFGYDPLFFVPELGATFAELGVGSKNGLSHRARAMRAMRPQLMETLRLAKRESSR